MFLILITIFVWCFYFRFIRAFLSRRKLIYVEVQTFSSENIISRKQAKSNLSIVIEATTGVKVQNFMFDKFWYNFREKCLGIQII